MNSLSNDINDIPLNRVSVVSSHCPLNRRNDIISCLFTIHIKTQYQWIPILSVRWIMKSNECKKSEPKKKLIQGVSESLVSFIDETKCFWSQSSSALPKKCVIHLQYDTNSNESLFAMLLSMRYSIFCSTILRIIFVYFEQEFNNKGKAHHFLSSLWLIGQILCLPYERLDFTIAMSSHFAANFTDW